MEETGADNVGGRVEGVGENAVGTAVALATASRFAVGGARFRYARRRCEAETVPFGCFRRSALERVGAFDESLILHEDYELNHRIRSSGGRIVLDPAIASRYWVRSSWTGLARQYFRYGRAKSAVARRAPGVVRPHHLAPPLLVLAMVPAALALRTVRGRRAVAAAATVYAAACAGAGIRAGRGAPAGARARVPLVFPTLHVCWGGGFLAGLVGRSPAAPRSAILATTPVHVPRVPVAQPAADSVALRSSSAPTASR